MIRPFLASSVALAILSSAPVSGQEASVPIEAAAQTPAGLIEALYGMVSFGPGPEPDWEMFRDVFLENALIVFSPSRTRPMLPMSVDGFIQDWKDFFRDAELEGKGEVVFIHMAGEVPHKKDKFWSIYDNDPIYMDVHVKKGHGRVVIRGRRKLLFRVAFPEYVAKRPRIVRSQISVAGGGTANSEMMENITAIARLVTTNNVTIAPNSPRLPTNGTAKITRAAPSTMTTCTAPTAV